MLLSLSKDINKILVFDDELPNSLDSKKDKNDQDTDTEGKSETTPEKNKTRSSKLGSIVKSLFSLLRRRDIVSSSQSSETDNPSESSGISDKRKVNENAEFEDEAVENDHIYAILNANADIVYFNKEDIERCSIVSNSNRTRSKSILDLIEPSDVMKIQRSKYVEAKNFHNNDELSLSDESIESTGLVPGIDSRRVSLIERERAQRCSVIYEDVARDSSESHRRSRSVPSKERDSMSRSTSRPPEKDAGTQKGSTTVGRHFEQRSSNQKLTSESKLRSRNVSPRGTRGNQQIDNQVGANYPSYGRSSIGCVYDARSNMKNDQSSQAGQYSRKFKIESDQVSRVSTSSRSSRASRASRASRSSRASSRMSNTSRKSVMVPNCAIDEYSRMTFSGYTYRY